MCPQKSVFRPAFEYAGPAANLLSYDDFVQALETVPRKIRISFAGFSEPFLNNRTLDMMEYARKRGHELSLFSTLVGLKREQVPKLKEIAPEIFVLHEPDNRGIAKIKITQAYMETFFEVITNGPRITNRSIMDNSFVSNERAGNCDGVAPRHVFGPIHCMAGKFLHPEFVMLPNCDLQICCMDWGLKHRMGNLLVQTWDDVVNAEPYQAILRESRRFDGNSLCRSCVYALPVVSPKRIRMALGETLDKIGISGQWSENRQRGR